MALQSEPQVVVGITAFSVFSTSRVRLGITPSIAYVDEAYSYRRTSVVCLSVGLSVCQSVTIVSPA